MRREDINNGISHIDADLVEEFILQKEKYEKRKFPAYLRVVATAACICLVFGAIFALPIYQNYISHSKEKVPVGEGMVTLDNGSGSGMWATTSNQNSILQKKLKAPSGKMLTIALDYSSYSNNDTSYKAENDICQEMFGQWISTIISFEYELNFKLFDEAFLKETVYKEFESKGYTTEKAFKKISQVTADTVGFDTCRAEYKLKSVSFDNIEKVNEFKQKWKDRFLKVGLDVEKIESLAFYEYEKIDLFLNEKFYIDALHAYDTVYTFYKYNGQWFMSPRYIDDDLTIDLLCSDHGEDGKGRGFYKRGSDAGAIESIEQGYIFLSTGEYYFISQDKFDFEIGDFVIIEYYQTGLTANRISDGRECRLLSIASISIYTE